MCSHPRSGTSGGNIEGGFKGAVWLQKPCWADTNLALLSEHAESADAEFGIEDRMTEASLRAGSGTLSNGGANSSKPASPPPPPPCNSEGLTVDSLGGGGDDNSPEPVTSRNTAAPPQADGNAAQPPQPARRHRRGGKQKRSGKYADLIGREVDVPASVFDIKVPDLYYRAVVKRKDTGHPGAVVIRFPEDGSSFWLPVDEVWRYIFDMEARRGRGNDSLTGEQCAKYAAEVLISLSGGVSTATRHSGQHGQRHRTAGGGDGAESAMATPVRKRMRQP